jgi:hypothetical protein
MDAAGRRKRVGGQAATRGGRIRTVGAAEGFFENAQAVFCKNATKSEFFFLDGRNRNFFFLVEEYFGT